MGRKANRNSLSVEQRQTLVEEHLKMVKPLAWGILRRYALPRHTLEDMIGEGKLGLVEAASRYREIEGGRFEFYATSYIRGKMLTSLKNLGILESGIMDVPQVPENKEPSLFDENLDQVLDQLEQLRQSRRLTERQTAVVKARLKDRKTFAQIGREMGITWSGARNIMYSVLPKIGLALSGYKAKHASSTRTSRRQMVVNHLRSALPSGTSQEKIAVSIGITPEYFHWLLSYKAGVPSLAVALLLARRLRKPVEELFHLDESKEAYHGNSNS